MVGSAPYIILRLVTPLLVKAPAGNYNKHMSKRPNAKIAATTTRISHVGTERTAKDTAKVKS